MRILLWTLAWGWVGSMAWAQEVSARLELEGRLWGPTLTAYARTAVADRLATDVDLKRDLGVSDRRFPEARLTWSIGRKHRLRLAYTAIDYQGDRVVQTTVRFRGRTYEFGTRVASAFRLRYLRFGWTWRLIDLGDGVVRLEPLLDLKGLRAEGSLTTPDLPVPVSAARTWWAGAPTPGAALEVQPSDWIGMFAEISGLPVGSYGAFWDWEVGVQVTPVRYLRLSGGYRYLHGRAESGTDFVRVTLAGPFLAAALRF
ncbi:hypothetical protein HRbin11_00933 [bacterium HR11]|nr:hypothetical protein HRbin11_00933 [bacterium HR11]